MNYRLAPEHTHPAAVNDAVLAYEWLLSAGYAPAKIALSGDSAGGGLSLALMANMFIGGGSLALPLFIFK